MKSLINTALLAEQLKRFWLIGAAFILIYLLIGILPLYSADPRDAWFIQARNLINLLSMQHPLPILVMLLAPFCAVMAFYPYHFASNAAGAFYTFPVNKRQLFWTNAAASLILMLGPLLLFCLFLLIPIFHHEAINQDTWRVIYFPPAIFPREVPVGAVINTIPVIAAFFARIAVGIIFYFAVFLLAVSVSGTRLISILLCGAFLILPVSVHFLADVIGLLYVFGHDGLQNTRIANTFVYTNPVMWGYLIDGRSIVGGINRIIRGMSPSHTGLWPYFLVYIGITAVLTVIAYVCSHKRKPERAGDSVVFVVLKNVCVFALAMAGMIVMGAFLAMMFHSRAALYFGFILGFALAYFIAQMIAEKTFNISHKVKGLIPFGAVMAGLYVLMLLITTYGLSFYVNRLPRASEVSAVSLSHSFAWRGTDYTQDPQAIAQTLEVHRQILENRRYLRRVFWQANFGHWQNTQTVPIFYIFHDGTVMQRRYILSFDFMVSSGLDELMRSPAMILAEIPAFRQPELIERIDITIWDDGSRSGEIVTYAAGQAEVISLLAAVKEDYIVQLTREWNDRMDGEFGWSRQTSIGLHVLTYPHVHDDQWWGLWLPTLDFDHAENTMAWLARRGFVVEG